MLESGTEGLACNATTIIPKKTEGYKSPAREGESEIPQCTLKHYPSSIDHTIQYAMSEFKSLFEDNAKFTNDYLDNPNSFSVNIKKNINNVDSTEKIKSVYSNLVISRSKTFVDCVEWARNLFEYYFVNIIEDLLFTHPINSFGSNNLPFWGSYRKIPSPIKFNVDNEDHYNFVKSASILRGILFQIMEKDINIDDKDEFLKIIGNMKIQEHQKTKIDDDQNNINEFDIISELNNNNIDDFLNEISSSVSSLLSSSGSSLSSSGSSLSSPVSSLSLSTSSLSSPVSSLSSSVSSLSSSVSSLSSLSSSDSSLSSLSLYPVGFEKDDDVHMKFICSVANIRASCYKIPPGKYNEIKKIVGKIIPAVASTTAFISGFILPL
jgi:ubiquitin-activating enzyme E1